MEAEGRSPITDGVKLPMINALRVQSKTAREIDLEAGATPLGWLGDPETLSERDGV